MCSKQQPHFQDINKLKYINIRKVLKNSKLKESLLYINVVLKETDVGGLMVEFYKSQYFNLVMYSKSIKISSDMKETIN